MSQKNPPNYGHGARKVAKTVNDGAAKTVRMNEDQPGRTGKMAGPGHTTPKHC